MSVKAKPSTGRQRSGSKISETMTTIVADAYPAMASSSLSMSSGSSGATEEVPGMSRIEGERGPPEPAREGAGRGGPPGHGTALAAAAPKVVPVRPLHDTTSDALIR